MNIRKIKITSKWKVNKKMIFLLYRYYLLPSIIIFEEEKHQINIFLEKENYLIIQIEKNLKKTWNFHRLSCLERAILIFSSYELIFNNYGFSGALLINQVIDFSKKYLEENKYKYINKVLDLIYKEGLPSVLIG